MTMIDNDIKIPEGVAGFDAMAYFKDLTEHNRTAVDSGFFPCACSGPMSLEGLLTNMKGHSRFVAIDDTNEGTVIENSGGFFKRVTVTVWILSKYKFNDMNDRENQLKLCRKVFRQFMSRILKDKYRWEMDFTYLLDRSIDTREIGRYFINGLTGVEFMLDIQQPFDLVYDEREWI